MAIDQTLHDRLGGRPTIEKVHKKFYDKIYAHPWIGKYFEHQPQHLIEAQQNDYMIQLMGGPKCYAGQAPNVVHGYMMITEELFDLRSQLLSEAIEETGVSDALRQEWIAANEMFKAVLVKSSEAECVLQYSHQKILNFPK